MALGRDSTVASEGDDSSRYLESIGKLLGALVEVSSYFLAELAKSSGQEPEELLALTRRICEEHFGSPEQK